MTGEEALCALGVRPDTLTPAQREQLDRDGFLPLPGVLTPEQVRTMRTWLEDRVIQEGAAGGQELAYPLDPGDGTLADVINKDPMFDICFTHPQVLAAVRHVLGSEFKLSSVNYRSPRPGHGLQGLHADWDDPVAPGDYCVCNSLWLLDDFTADMGVTRLVPGTHRSGKQPGDVLTDPAATHPDEVKVVGPAGTVVVFNAHVWHGGTRNESAGPRPALLGYFCRRDQPQQMDQRRFLRPETAARLSPAARHVLDV